jgi:hypothetical protein
MSSNKWNRPDAPPPPLFTGQKERDFAKQIADEIIEGVVGQTVLYFPISLENTNFHPIYGEAINKTFLPPIRVYARVLYEGQEQQTTDMGVDKKSKLKIFFHKRRLAEDQDLFIREGDFIQYGDNFYELTQLNEPKQLYGQIDYRYEIEATAIRSRKGVFK